MTAPAPDAKALVDQMTPDPTLDTYFERNPADLTDAELDAFIASERQRRADFIAKDGQ